MCKPSGFIGQSYLNLAFKPDAWRQEFKKIGGCMGTIAQKKLRSLSQIKVASVYGTFGEKNKKSLLQFVAVWCILIIVVFELCTNVAGWSSW